jgi:hypothetical protein
MVSEYDVHAALRPLRMIFWGGLLWIVDIKINGFDICNDVLATILIALAVFRLARIDVSDRYRSAMTFVKVMALISVVRSAVQLFNLDLGSLSILFTLISLAQLSATIIFSLSMHWLCREAGMPRSAASWKLTMILFIAIYAVPLGCVYLAGIFAQITGSDFHYNFGAAVVLPALIAFFTPIVHLFISTSRMRREAAGGGTYTGHGFEVLPPRGPDAP